MKTPKLNNSEKLANMKTPKLNNSEKLVKYGYSISSDPYGTFFTTKEDAISYIEYHNNGRDVNMSIKDIYGTSDEK